MAGGAPSRCALAHATVFAAAREYRLRHCARLVGERQRSALVKIGRRHAAVAGSAIYYYVFDLNRDSCFRVRQTDRQRNARPKPRTTILVVWRTDTELPNRVGMNIPSSAPGVLDLRGSTGDIHTNWLENYPSPNAAPAPPATRNAQAAANRCPKPTRTPRW